MSAGGLAARALGGLLAPSLCWACNGRADRGQPLCRTCRLGLRRLGPEPVLVGGVRVWAPVAYMGPARELVRALKFRGATDLADFMAGQIAANVPPDVLAGAAWPGAALVPVPLHPRRLRSRGYNQAALIAAALARRTGLPVADPLVRSGAAATQVGRARSERRAGPAGAITSRPESAVPRHALLVDDVATTGATLRACRSALVAAGAVEVEALTFARTLGR